MPSDSGRQPPIQRPRLRSLDVIRVKTKDGMATALRDGEGIGESVVVKPPLDRALGMFDGAHTLDEVARSHPRFDVAELRALVAQLDAAYLLDNARSRERRLALVAAFRRASVREATHAGGAYHGEARALAKFIERECLGAVNETRDGASDGEPVVALVAPHMDLWRASAGYGHAYAALKAGLPEEADTFVLLGTCHAGLARPFAVCRKAFETPFGPLACDDELVDALAEASPFDVFEDEYQHKGEHSIEFQAVFLRHLLGETRAKAARIVPILCGLGRSQARREDPRRDREAERFVAALSELVAARGKRTVVIAGADLAHVGPRFGDPRPLDTRGRDALETVDKASVAHALAGDAEAFFRHTTSDLDRRRVCGVGPVYTLLRLTEALGAARSSLHHYTQHVDPREGSIVSHASISFRR